MDARVKAVARELARESAVNQLYSDREAEIIANARWPEYADRAARLLAAADAHPSPAQQQARELLDKAGVRGPVYTAADGLWSAEDDCLVELYDDQTLLNSLASIINLACGWEAAE